MLAKILQNKEKPIYFWTAFKYVKLINFKTTHAIKNANGYTTVFLKGKDVLVSKSTISKLHSNLETDLIISAWIANIKITKDIVFKVSISQLAAKAPRCDKIDLKFYQWYWVLVKSYLVIRFLNNIGKNQKKVMEQKTFLVLWKLF